MSETENDPPTAPEPDVAPPEPDVAPPAAVPPVPEVGGRAGLDPTRYGDWENKGIASDF